MHGGICPRTGRTVTSIACSLQSDQDSLAMPGSHIATYLNCNGGRTKQRQYRWSQTHRSTILMYSLQISLQEKNIKQSSTDLPKSHSMSPETSSREYPALAQWSKLRPHTTDVHCNVHYYY